MEHPWFSVGFVFIIIGILIILASTLANQKTESKFAIGGFIGFIPFGFGNDKRLVVSLIVLSIILGIAMYLTYTK